MPDHKAPNAAPADVAHEGMGDRLDDAVNMDARPNNIGDEEALHRAVPAPTLFEVASSEQCPVSNTCCIQTRRIKPGCPEHVQGW